MDAQVNTMHRSGTLPGFPTAHSLWMASVCCVPVSKIFTCALAGCSWMMGLGHRMSSSHGVPALLRPYANLRSGPVLSFSAKDGEDSDEDDWDG